MQGEIAAWGSRVRLPRHWDQKTTTLGAFFRFFPPSPPSAAASALKAATSSSTACCFCSLFFDFLPTVGPACSTQGESGAVMMVVR